MGILKWAGKTRHSGNYPVTRVLKGNNSLRETPKHFTLNRKKVSGCFHKLKITELAVLQSGPLWSGRKTLQHPAFILHSPCSSENLPPPLHQTTCLLLTSLCVLIQLISSFETSLLSCHSKFKELIQPISTFSVDSSSQRWLWNGRSQMFHSAFRLLCTDCRSSSVLALHLKNTCINKRP